MMFNRMPFARFTSLTFLLGLLFVFSFSVAQESVADTSKVFNSMAEAMVNPLAVYKLNLRNKGMKTIPEEIFEFKNLISLDLSRNRLKEVSPFIEKLKNLEWLDLSKNKIKNLPEEMGRLSALKILMVARNNLYAFPVSFGALANLEYLDAWDNHLAPIPSEMGNLKKLQVLDLRGILFSEEDHARMRELLPNTEIFLSPSCNCKN